LGTLLDGEDRPDLWFAEDLLECAGKVVARSGDGDLFFVGRSLDSMFDLLGGALAATSWSSRLHRLPVSFAVSGRFADGRWRSARISHAQHEQARRILAELGLSPHALARRDRPVAFVDVVHSGSTFTKLFSHRPNAPPSTRPSSPPTPMPGSPTIRARGSAPHHCYATSRKRLQYKEPRPRTRSRPG